MKKFHKYNRNPLYFFIILFLALISIVIYCLSNHIKPIIHTLADNKSRISATQCLNSAVARELSEGNIKYDNLVDIKLNDRGEVTSLSTNIVNINNMKAQISKRISDELEENDLKNSKISVPIGTLLGWQISSGRGKSVSFGMTTRSYVKTEIRNDFKQAGINQTLHRIMLCVNVKVTSIFAKYNVYSEINSNFCIAETIIVGTVPSSFTEVYDSQNSPAQNALDYGE